MTQGKYKKVNKKYLKMSAKKGILNATNTVFRGKF